MGCSSSNNANGKGPTKIKETDKAILDCRIRIREVKTRITKLEERSKENRRTAIQEAKAGDKRKAVMALKLKKMHDSEIEKAQNIQLTLVSTITKLEETQINVDVFEVLKESDQVIEELIAKVSMPKLEDIYDNMQERNDMQKEISDFMSAQVLNEDDFEEELDELDKELEGLDEIEFQNKIQGEELNAPKKEVDDTTEKNERKLVPAT